MPQNPVSTMWKDATELSKVASSSCLRFPKRVSNLASCCLSERDQRVADVAEQARWRIHSARWIWHWTRGSAGLVHPTFFATCPETLVSLAHFHVQCCSHPQSRFQQRGIRPVAHFTRHVTFALPNTHAKQQRWKKIMYLSVSLSHPRLSTYGSACHQSTLFFELMKSKHSNSCCLFVGPATLPQLHHGQNGLNQHKSGKRMTCMALWKNICPLGHTEDQLFFEWYLRMASSWLIYAFET